MKRLALCITTLSLVCIAGALYSSRISDYQVADVYICSQGIILAELQAKAALNRQELTSVSYCSCEGIDPSFKTEVKKGSCEPPNDLVYSCSCIGRTGY